MFWLITIVLTIKAVDSVTKDTNPSYSQAGAVGHAHEMLFLRQLLDGLSFLPEEPTPLHCDNDATSCLTEDQTGHPSIKHICVKFHSVRQLIEEEEIKVTHIWSADNMADILTKPLRRSDFLRLRQYLGICPSS